MNYSIPFVTSRDDIDLLRKLNFPCDIVRTTLDKTDILEALSGYKDVWLDAAVDGLHSWKPADKPEKETSYWKYMKAFTNWEYFVEKERLNRPDKSMVGEFVASVLDKCKAQGPIWLSVPQLPIVADNSLSKINELLAEATGKRSREEGFSTKLILPVVLTHQTQTKFKQNRTKIVNSVAKSYDASGARGLWIVDSSLNDESGSDTLKSKFQKLIEFHTDIMAKLGDNNVIIIAGPYWHMNLVLWARGLATYPAVGLGKGFQYLMPGGPAKTSKKRVAIVPLRMRAVVSPDFQRWLDDAVRLQSIDVSTREQLKTLQKHINMGKDARNQVAEAYMEWIEKIAALPEAGRALALYQDLSNSYIIGKAIKKRLSEDEGPGRAPEKVAQQFMLNCL